MIRLRYLLAAFFVAGAAAVISFSLGKPTPAVANAVTPGTVTYTFDSLGRLLSDGAVGSYGATYDYDVGNNRTVSGLQ